MGMLVSNPIGITTRTGRLISANEALLRVRGMISPLGEMLLAVSATPAALAFMWLFFRSWRRAIEEAPALSS